jgi:hypothetical protein
VRGYSSWDNFLKKNKKKSRLFRDFSVSYNSMLFSNEASMQQVMAYQLLATATT